MIFKIAFLQLLPGKTLEEQLRIGVEACRKAKDLGADVALFPEMWSDGYELPQDEERLKSLAISSESDFVLTFRDLARELKMAIGITFLEQHDPRPLNSVIFFDRNGKEILHYSKVQICAFDAEKVLCGGDDFYTAELDFGRGTVKIGSMICFDREFPESARILCLKALNSFLLQMPALWRSIDCLHLEPGHMKIWWLLQRVIILTGSLIVTDILRFLTVSRGSEMNPESETCVCSKHREIPESMLPNLILIS